LRGFIELLFLGDKGETPCSTVLSLIVGEVPSIGMLSDVVVGSDFCRFLLGKDSNDCFLNPDTWRFDNEEEKDDIFHRYILIVCLFHDSTRSATTKSRKDLKEDSLSYLICCKCFFSN
jgi:hypothetical protein